MTNERTQDPDQLRREIAATRADMDRTLAELEDRVSPSRIRERQTAKVRSRWDGVKTSVMGAAEEVNGTLDDAQQAVQQAPHELESATRGNPLAAGLIAFGIGSIAGSLFPATTPERKVADELRDQLEEPFNEQLQRSGHEIGNELQEHAQEAMEDTKQTAQQASERVQVDVRTSAEQVQDQAQHSVETVRSQS